MVWNSFKLLELNVDAGVKEMEEIIAGAMDRNVAKPWITLYGFIESRLTPPREKR